MAILLELFEENISKFLSSLGLATREDVEIIEDRLGRLEERLTDIKSVYRAAASLKPAAKGPQREAAPLKAVKKASAKPKPKSAPKKAPRRAVKV